MKKILIALTLTLTLLATCLVGCEFIPGGDSAQDDKLMTASAAVFTLDVNPGVRIYVKEDNTVIAVKATNEDGEEIVAELEVEGVNYEEVVETVIDKMEEHGYLVGEENSVLISVEKKLVDISERLNEKITSAFEKHGKRASVIEQELDKLNKELEGAINKIAEKYNISEGKALIIEKIREEFPEFSEKDLASLKIEDLRIILEDTSEDIKEHFKKIGEAIEGAYIARQEALANALASLEELEINIEDVQMARVRIDREDGKMLYEVKFVYEGMEYEITVDAKTGDILETEIEEFREFDAEGFIDDLCNKHGIDLGGIKDSILNGIFGKGEEEMTRGELIAEVLKALNISEETLDDIDMDFHQTESGAVFSVTVELEDGDVYHLVVSAYNGEILKAELNGNVIEISKKAS